MNLFINDSIHEAFGQRVLLHATALCHQRVFDWPNTGVGDYEPYPRLKFFGVTPIPGCVRFYQVT